MSPVGVERRLPGAGLLEEGGEGRPAVHGRRGPSAAVGRAAGPVRPAEGEGQR